MNGNVSIRSLRGFRVQALTDDPSPPVQVRLVGTPGVTELGTPVSWMFAAKAATANEAPRKRLLAKCIMMCDY